ncbi:MAG TPA: methylmalonyl-CoA mutase family protein [Acidimicrobiales bacterium]|nr:methylmalonyl-CoA mutase family protein [Acidimicrobiales bacterium]
MSSNGHEAAEVERRTLSGLPLGESYPLEPRPGVEVPGEYPFTRGRPRRGAGAGWTHRELSGEGGPTASNAQFRYLIEHGAHGVDVIGDMPTQAHMDADHPMARMSLGTNGVSVSTLDDFVELYRDIALDAISLSHSLPPAFTVAGLYLAAERHGYDPAVLRGSVLQVPFYTEDCAYATHLPPAIRMRLSCDAIAFCAEHMPKFHGFIEDTYYISDNGMDAVTEMALGFIEIRALVRMLQSRGVPIDSYAPRIGILVNCRMDLFEEIAKVRATRRIYARMMREEFGATDPRSWAAPVTVHTSGLTLTAQQPVNNVVRGALQAFAMVLAGVDALEISTFDEGFRTPGPESHLVALRTQQIIALESGAGSVRDPLGGSFLVEALTDEMEARILAMVDEIESHGDPVDLLSDGYFRSYFESATVEHARAVADGERRLVGLTDFVVADEDDVLLREISEEKIPPALDQIEVVRRFKAERDLNATRAALDDVRAAGTDPDADLMAPIIAAFHARATLGEIAGVLRESQGQPFDPYRQVSAP